MRQTSSKRSAKKVRNSAPVGGGWGEGVMLVIREHKHKVKNSPLSAASANSNKEFEWLVAVSAMAGTQTGFEPSCPTALEGALNLLATRQRVLLPLPDALVHVEAVLDDVHSVLARSAMVRDCPRTRGIERSHPSVPAIVSAAHLKTSTCNSRRCLSLTASPNIKAPDG